MIRIAAIVLISLVSGCNGFQPGDSCSVYSIYPGLSVNSNSVELLDDVQQVFERTLVAMGYTRASEEIWTSEKVCSGKLLRHSTSSTEIIYFRWEVYESFHGRNMIELIREINQRALEEGLEVEALANEIKSVELLSTATQN